MKEYPKVYDESKVGEYPAIAKAGGGYVWDEVLEYRVWCHPENGAKDLENGNDYYYAFMDFESAYKFAIENEGTEEPLALILQKEYIDEPEPGQFIHMKEERITEWPVHFLSRPKRDDYTLPNFFSPDAPTNRLDIIRGLKENETIQKEEIFISEINEQLDRAIIVEGDNHSIWAYCMKVEGSEQELLFHGFICSRGTVVNDLDDVENYIDLDLQPPLAQEYKNEFSILATIKEEDFQIQWKDEEGRIEIFINTILYLIMDMNNNISFSKAIDIDGLYGKPISDLKQK